MNESSLGVTLVNGDSRKLGETDHRSPIKTTRTIGTRIESRARIHALQHARERCVWDDRYLIYRTGKILSNLAPKV